MRILYLSLSYVPSRRASSVQVMRMCEAFAAEGHEVTLVAKRDDEASARGMEVHSFYGVAPSFEVRRIARPRRRGGGVVYAAGMVAALLRQRPRIDLVYSRDLIGGVVAADLGVPVAFEAHGVFESPWHRALWRRMMRSRSFRGLIAISEAMVQELGEVELLPRDRPVVVAHSPAQADPDGRPRPVSGPRPRVGYVGNLYPGRGVELVIEIATRMPHCDFELIGGTEDDLARWRASGPPANVVFRGFVPPGQLQSHYRALDVLLMPYPRAGIHGAAQQIDTAKYCSPMKMFEYMASGVPMVASDLPVLQEVLGHRRNALIAAADDVAAWQVAITELLENEGLRDGLARQALADLEAYTPRARTRRIFQGLGLDSTAASAR